MMRLALYISVDVERDCPIQVKAGVKALLYQVWQ